LFLIFFFQAEDGIRDRNVTGVQTCALPIFTHWNNIDYYPFISMALEQTKSQYTNTTKSVQPHPNISNILTTTNIFPISYASKHNIKNRYADSRDLNHCITGKKLPHHGSLCPFNGG